MDIAKPLRLIAALASLTLAACTGTTGEVEETGTAQEAALINNSLTNNSLTNNSLTNNSLTNNSLTNNSLTNNSLTNNSLINNALTDPSSREVLKYIVSCALPEGETVTATVEGVNYSFDGQLGLAPEWGGSHGHCDARCQEWVSACLLARVDYYGVEKQISVRGQNKALSTTDQESSFTANEATYFGNVFQSPQIRYACLAPGQTEIPRVCGPSIDDCVVTVVGSCDEVCERPQADGAFRNCRVPGQVDKPVYHGSITVFLDPLQ